MKEANVEETTQQQQTEVPREIRDTEPAPPMMHLPAFGVVEATLWLVVTSFFPDATGKERVLMRRYFLTADPSGRELHAVVQAVWTQENPACRDVLVQSAERLGEVRGSALRSAASA